MKIGISYDLRDEYLKEGYSEEETAEFDREDTIQSIEENLVGLGFETDRIGHMRSLISKLLKGERWDFVFNIAEGLRGVSREAQIPHILEAYGLQYTFSDPIVLSVTLNKAITKRIIRDLGIPTADFILIENESDIRRFNLPFPVFAKPVAEGTGKGINAQSKIDKYTQLSELTESLLQRYQQPVLIETFLSGREFTVGIIGTGKEAIALGVMEVILKNEAEKNAYSYWNKEKCEDLVNFGLVTGSIEKEAKEMALLAYRGLGCRDAGRVDLRADERGKLHFLEINPLPGLHPEHSDLPILSSLVGISYNQLIKLIMESALKRIKSN